MVHPRVRGCDGCATASPMPCIGFIPDARVRDSEAQRSDWTAGWFIPACAGASVSRAAAPGAPSSGSSPHARVHQSELDSESFECVPVHPRVRGCCQLLNVARARPIRFIPACAGKLLLWAVPRAVCRRFIPALPGEARCQDAQIDLLDG